MSRSLNSSTAAARALVDALILHGVRHVVLSPGSRSAPLAYALARAADAGRVEVHVRIDERVAAFTALGLARFGPAAVVTTSGTAAANLHPALLEARHSRLGLIAITADRPHEMRGVGANQTTDQLHMFGPHIPTVEIPAGVPGAAIVNQVSRIAARTFGAFAPPEPVHLNIAFRDPLVPEHAGQEHAGQEQTEAPSPPGAHIAPSRTVPGAAEIDVEAPTVVVAGDGSGQQAATFAEQAQLPLLAEPSSGARGGRTAIGPYQHLLADLSPQVEQVVVFGRPTLSRPVSRLLETTARVTIVADSPEWVDVTGSAEQVVGRVTAGGARPDWLAQWQEAAKAWTAAQETGLAGAVVSRALGAGQQQVMIGSSMAIRYADIHAPVGESFTAAPVYAARGLAGIDGTISTASGIGLGSGPIRAIVGDLTFAHDVGALALGPSERAPDIHIVVLNDGGGGIFARLEHGEERYAATFERYFATPVNLEMKHIAAAYGYEYRTITRADEIEDALTPEIRGRSILEVHLPTVSGNSQEFFRSVSA